MAKGIVGNDITFQLVGASGPVSLGTFDEYEITPNPEVNERALMNGDTESEVTGMNPWTIRLKRAKRDSSVDALWDAASDPATAPSLQAVETIAYRSGTVKQYLFTGITLRGGGTTAARTVDENLELAADKRQPVS